MAWDTEGTRCKILEAAVTEFAAHGPDGTTIERIAKAAGVNKERVYNYFGGKQQLFARVLRDELAQVAQAVPVASFADAAEVGAYAGRVYDYHRAHPALGRLLRWESLAFDGEVPDEEQRRGYYGEKTGAVAAAQRAGVVTDDVAAEHLMFLILALAGWWTVMPQIARMIAGPLSEAEHARRRAAVVRSAQRLAQVAQVAPESGAS